jgi:hypothetical protein
MLRLRILSLLSAAASLSAIPQAATAGRTAVDGGTIMTIGGYCSPNSVGTPDCDPRSLPSAITIGGTSYSSFWVSSDGVVSFESIAAHLATQDSVPTTGPTFGSLGEFGSTPVFSPFFADGPGYQDFPNGDQYDGAFIADTTPTATGFHVDFYTCGSPLFCGPRTEDLLAGATFSQDDYDAFTGLSFAVAQQSKLGPGVGTGQEQFDSGLAFLLSDIQVYSMTLSALVGGGFQVDYTYSDDALGLVRPSGFSAGGTLVEEIAPLSDRSVVFDASGHLVSGGVPEPSTWMSLLLVFGLAGFALRRQRLLQFSA